MTTRYLIKATYLEGPHKGKSHLLQKGGYVTDEACIQWADTTYKTLGIARGVCKKLYAENERQRDFERRMEAVNIKRGFKSKDFYIYESQSYEPFAVESVD